MNELKVGDCIPDFTLLDHEGTSCSKADVLGNPQIIYFYPKDNTPGCTKEACGFNEKMDLLDDIGISVIGVSPDHIKSHQKFIEKQGLEFTLLSDPEKVMAKSFGALNEDNKIIRSTFLIDEEGMVQ
ncbi:MAG: peroxiredoxin, partial [Waddliaceae bacterium]